MGKLGKLIDQLGNASEGSQEQLLLAIINDNKSFVLDLETNRLFKGLDADDNPLVPPYRSKAYAEFKLTLNPAGVVDLKLTGAFWSGFTIDISNFPITFDSTDPKTPILAEKYGKIFGIDQEGFSEIKAQIIQQTIDAYRTQVYQVR